MFETSTIELSQSALRKNIRFLRRTLPKGVTFCSVIKGNAYGHDISSFLPMAEQCGIRHFAVFSADEAYRALNSRTEHSHIMIMGNVNKDEVSWAVENDISFFVFNSDRLRRAVRAAKKQNRKARIHIEVETGLNRLGFSTSALKSAAKVIEANKDHLSIEGVCSHLAGAETLNNYHRIQAQITAFSDHLSFLDTFRQTLAINSFTRHLACSAAVFTFPNTIFDMARIGIAQYGFWPSKETEIHYLNTRQQSRRRKWIDPLCRVIKWRSQVMDTKRVKRGDHVGYGSSSLVTRALKVASVPVGYFHGFSRNLGNRGHVLVGGVRAPVLGTVNMNMMMVDITDIPNVRRGDEVVIIGKQKDQTISVGSFEEMSRFINYEILVRLPSEIPRVVVE
jgi:alanine racemase